MGWGDGGKEKSGGTGYMRLMRFVKELNNDTLSTQGVQGLMDAYGLTITSPDSAFDTAIADLRSKWSGEAPADPGFQAYVPETQDNDDEGSGSYSSSFSSTTEGAGGASPGRNARRGNKTQRPTENEATRDQ